MLFYLLSEILSLSDATLAASPKTFDSLVTFYRQNTFVLFLSKNRLQFIYPLQTGEPFKER